MEIDSLVSTILNKTFELYSTEDGKKMGSMVFIKNESNHFTKEELPTEISEKFDNQSNIQDLKLFPNPTNNDFKISFQSKEPQDFQLSIIDSKGSVVYEKQLRNFEGQFNEGVDLSAYENGIYFFNLSSKEKNITKKIVVQ